MADFYKGAAKRIEDVDLPRVAHRIGVGEDEIHAVLDVESRGHGFDNSGRVIMLFEPHVFYRQLSGAKRDQAVKQGLAYKNWGTKRYPKDSYPRLLKAMEIDKVAAVNSCSWGLGQIMGYHAASLGYTNSVAMVKTFAADEDKQLEAIIEFIIVNGLDDELRRHDWVSFARGYNGSGYKKHNYHGRLAARYAHWKKIPDTPWSPEDAVKEEVEAPNVPEPVVEEKVKVVEKSVNKTVPTTIGVLLGGLIATLFVYWNAFITWLGF